MAMVSDENGCRSPNGSGGAGQGSCEAGLRWKRWDGMKREREGKKECWGSEGSGGGSRCCCCMVHIYLMYKRLFPLFNFFFSFSFSFRALNRSSVRGHGGFYRTFFQKNPLF